MIALLAPRVFILLGAAFALLFFVLVRRPARPGSPRARDPRRVAPVLLFLAALLLAAAAFAPGFEKVARLFRAS